MTCDPQTILDGLARQLASNSPCEDNLLELIPVFWDLTAQEGCYSTYLHMLLTKRETILAMMGCEANSVDSFDSHRVMDAKTVADSKSKLVTQAQSTGNATRYSTGHGETRYDETNTARSRRDMDRHGESTETGDGTGVYRDDGFGTGSNNSAAFNEIDAVDVALTNSESRGGSQETGFRSDCNYEYSTNNTNGQSAGLPPLAVASFSGGGSEWRKFTKTRAYDNDVSTHQTNQSSTHDVLDERRGQGTHTWGNFFQSDIEWHDRDYEIRRGHDRSDTEAHAEAHAQGNGDGFSEEKTRAHNASQGTATSTFDSLSTRTMNRTDSLTAIGLKNSQRFRNLRLLYDNLTLLIEQVKKRYRARATPYIAQLPCDCGTCCHCTAINLTSVGRHYAAY